MSDLPHFAAIGRVPRVSGSQGTQALVVTTAVDGPVAG